MNIHEIATKSDIEDIRTLIFQLHERIGEQFEQIFENKIYTINELAKMKVIGGYDKIKTLISKGILQTTADGKITQKSINEYLSLNKKK